MTNFLDFSQYIDETPQPGIQESISNTENFDQNYQNKNLDFSQYVEEEPSTAKEILRHGVRTGSRVAESIFGFPGDFVKFSDKISEKLPKGPSFLQREPSIVSKGIKKGLDILPTSEELKNISSYITSGFTDPQGAKEELGDEITSLASILSNPLKFPTKLGALSKLIGKNVLKATATKGAGKASEEYLGFGEKGKAGVELATLFLTGLYGEKTADAYVKDQYIKSKNLLPNQVLVPTSRLNDELTSIEKALRKGGIKTSSETPVLNDIKDIQNQIVGGYINGDELVEAYHKINRQMNSRSLFETLNSTELEILKKNYNKVKSALGNEISTLKEGYPEFYQTWKEANKSQAIIHESKKLSRNVSKIFKKNPHLSSYLAADLFYQKPIAAGATAGVATVAKTGELMYRVFKDNNLRKHYFQTLDSLIQKNEKEFIKQYNRLNKELEKEKDKTS